jgi:hypothetical protein
MSSSGKTDLQRDILVTWYENPNATNKEIAEACDCSASYVSDVKNRFDNYGEMEAMFDRQDRELEQMFGEGVLNSGSSGMGGSMAVANSGEPQGLAETYENLPDNAVGYIGRALILVITLYVAYQVLTILL